MSSAHTSDTITLKIKYCISILKLFVASLQRFRVIEVKLVMRITSHWVNYFCNGCININIGTTSGQPKILTDEVWNL